jgi:hypothetical protein
VRVEPREKIYSKGASAQLRVHANYSDGSDRDVTHLADFISNEKEIAAVSESGVVQVGQLEGETVIVTRFMGFVDASRISVPAERQLLDGHRGAAFRLEALTCAARTISGG